MQANPLQHGALGKEKIYNEILELKEVPYISVCGTSGCTTNCIPPLIRIFPITLLNDRADCIRLPRQAWNSHESEQDPEFCSNSQNDPLPPDTALNFLQIRDGH